MNLERSSGAHRNRSGIGEASGIEIDPQVGAAHGVDYEKARDCDRDERDTEREARPTHDGDVTNRGLRLMP